MEGRNTRLEETGSEAFYLQLQSRVVRQDNCIEEDYMGDSCSTHGTEVRSKIQLESWKEVYHLRDTGIGY
jgi:hypothetical protein